MEVKTLQEIIKTQQEHILALKITLDSLIEELDENEAIDFKRLEKKVDKRLKLFTKKEEQQSEDNIPPITFFNGPMGEA